MKTTTFRSLLSIAAVACAIFPASLASAQTEPESAIDNNAAADDECTDDFCFVEVPGTRCGLDWAYDNAKGKWQYQPHAGYSFMRRTDLDTKELAIYIQGGGACWSKATCGGADPSFSTANLVLNREAESDQSHTGWADTTDPSGPLYYAREVAFVPYCTGDFHSGTAPQVNYGTEQEPFPFNHVGGLNAEKIFASIKQRAGQDIERIVVLGTSAGGIGAILQLNRIRALWPNAEILLLSDSGTPFSRQNVALGVMEYLMNTWQVRRGLPDGAAKAIDFFDVLVWNTQTFPEIRQGLVVGYEDPILTLFTGLLGGLPPRDSFTTHLTEYVDLAATTETFEVFMVDRAGVITIAGQPHWGSRIHGYYQTSPTNVLSGEDLAQPAVLADFVHAWRSGTDAQWQSVHPRN